MQDTQKLCGVYFLYYRKRLVYIGRSRDIFARAGIHLRKSPFKFNCISCIILEPSELVAKERAFILLYKPPKNVLHTPKIKGSHQRARIMREYLAHQRLRANLT